MTIKKGAQFSPEEYSCMEMMSHMISQFKEQQGVGDACAEMMTQLADMQVSDSVCFDMMSQIMASCCGIEHVEDNITRKV